MELNIFNCGAEFFLKIKGFKKPIKETFDLKISRVDP
jgi:hypothetical protein